MTFADSGKDFLGQPARAPRVGDRVLDVIGERFQRLYTVASVSPMPESSPWSGLAIRSTNDELHFWLPEYSADYVIL